jgi:RimJ/RimL family protein N-acetyltransferase
MAEIVLQTERLRLELQNAADTLRWIDSLDETTRFEVSPEYIKRLQTVDGADPWTCMFTMVCSTTGDVVGSCAFKGPPNLEGVVEIAYGVEPEQQGRGYATEAAQALVAFCRTTDNVQVVRAHTLLDNSASARVLEKSGFHFVSEVMDPEDGLVSRWEQTRDR